MLTDIYLPFTGLERSISRLLLQVFFGLGCMSYLYYLIANRSHNSIDNHFAQLQSVLGVGYWLIVCCMVYFISIQYLGYKIDKGWVQYPAIELFTLLVISPYLIKIYFLMVAISRTNHSLFNRALWHVAITNLIFGTCLPLLSIYTTDVEKFFSYFMLGGCLIYALLAISQDWILGLPRKTLIRLVFLFGNALLQVSLLVVFYCIAHTGKLFNLEFIIKSSYYFPFYLGAGIIFFTLVTILFIIVNIFSSGTFTKHLQEIEAYQSLFEFNPLTENQNGLIKRFFTQLNNLPDVDMCVIETVPQNQLLFSSKFDYPQLTQLKTQLKLSSQDFANQSYYHLKKIKPALKGLELKSVVILPLRKSEKIWAYVYIGSNKADVFSETQLRIMENLRQQVSFFINYNDLYVNLVEQQVQRTQMKMALEAGKGLIPKNEPTLNGVELSCYLKFNEAVGGDFYDFYETDNKAIFILGDVVGKGYEASVHTAYCKGLFNSIAPQAADLKVLNRKMNQHLMQVFEFGNFITAIMVEVNIRKRQIEILRAGHPPALFFQRSTGSWQIIEPKGTALGLLSDDTIDSATEVSTLDY